MLFRSPNPSFKASTVKTVGVANSNTADVTLRAEYCGNSVLYIPIIDWYGVNNGDDDGDSVSYIIIDDVLDWALNPRNANLVKKSNLLKSKLF